MTEREPLKAEELKTATEGVQEIADNLTAIKGAKYAGAVMAMAALVRFGGKVASGHEDPSVAVLATLTISQAGCAMHIALGVSHEEFQKDVEAFLGNVSGTFDAVQAARKH